VETILGDILTWSWFSEPQGYNFNGLLIPHAAGNICIDPVEPGEEVLSELACRGVSQIIVTNRNHVRAANCVRERTGARTLIHPADAVHATNQGAIVDGELRVGARSPKCDRRRTHAGAPIRRPKHPNQPSLGNGGHKRKIFPANDEKQTHEAEEGADTCPAFRCPVFYRAHGFGGELINCIASLS
jgi:hypothetical protein